jgi:carboxyl-terminal processing protease
MIRYARPRWILLSTLLTIALTAGLLWAPGSVTQARAADAPIVFAALRVLTEQHIDSPDALRLLAGAANGLRQALAAAGVAEPLADLTAANDADARAEFQQRFDQAAGLANGRLSETSLQYAAVRGMAASVSGSHTAFMDPQQWQAKQARYRNEASYSGIGTRSIVRDGRFYFLEVFPDSPAARAGIRPLDRVTAIDGQSVEGMNNQEFSNRIRGAAGTEVQLTVQRQGEGGPVTIAVRRGQIVRPTIEMRMLEGAVGYLKFSQFIPGSAAQVRGALEHLKREGLRGLVLDLRGNNGGRLNELFQIASMLLPPGLTISVREDRQQGRVTDVTGGVPVIDPEIPMTVLTDEGTASAAEMLSAALQEHGRGTIVGVRSAGSVQVSIDVPLPGGTAIQVAIRRVLTGRGVVLEGNGVRPDVVVVLTAADLDEGIDAQFQRSVQVIAQRAAARPAWQGAAGMWTRIFGGRVTAHRPAASAPRRPSIYPA